VAGTLVAYRRSERERRQVRSAFQRYVAPAVVERIAADPSRLRLGGETRETTVLFSDVRDFTSRAEKLDAEGVVRLLNALHTPLTAAVLAQGGTVDKYMGDGLMAFWNAPLDAPDHAERACAAALAMQEAVAALDARMEMEAQASGREHQPLRIGIGLKTGLAFVGNMGSEQRFDYSMVGDTVNIAARLEAATKTLRAPILVSAETARQAPGFLFTPMGEVALKGKSLKEDVFALHARKTSQDYDFEDFLRLHNEALSAVLQGRLDARERIREACGHPQGARYEAFYAHGLQGETPATGKKPGGS
jgi:adenylate cyclase